MVKLSINKRNSGYKNEEVTSMSWQQRLKIMNTVSPK